MLIVSSAVKVIFDEPKLVDNADPVISPPDEATVYVAGSISQLPVAP